MIENIIKLSKARIKNFTEENDGWYKGSKTYWKCLKEEIKEAKDENKKNNSVYLEDELGDVFWVYICLLSSLKTEGKIKSIDSVFSRCYEKYFGRIQENGKDRGDWQEVKKKQKQKRKEEHEKLYGEKDLP